MTAKQLLEQKIKQVEKEISEYNSILHNLKATYNTYQKEK